MADIQSQYYRLPEEDMQALIQRAKKGDDKSQEKLLYEFRNYLSKYVQLLYYIRWDHTNYDMRKFVALFVREDGLRWHLLRGTLNGGGIANVNKILHDLHFMISRYGTEEDVQQTVDMTFLQCVQKYERSRSKKNSDEWVPFSGFIYSYFYYLLQKNVKVFLLDQLGRKTFPLIDSGSSGEEEDEISPGFAAPLGPSVEEMIGPEVLDEKWVLGDSVFPPFDGLSIQDRQILKWRYVDGLKSSEIARKVSEHPNTIREHLSRIKSKVSETIGKDVIE